MVASMVGWMAEKLVETMELKLADDSVDWLVGP